MEYLKLPPEAFFNHLKDETEKAYDNSPVKKFKLYYSICGTSIKRGKEVVFGLNWGGSNKAGENYEAQKFMPENKSDSDEYKFIKAQLPFFENYLQIRSVDEINYTNLCFFRSTKINDLKKDDWDNSLKLFDLFIKYINPERLIFASIGTASVTKLFSLDSFHKIQEKSFAQGDKIFTAYKGKYKNSIDVYTVPYPYRAGGINNDTRHKIWDWLLPKQK
ncbi:MAG: hypothetical protein KBC43_11605 [Bacteroidales bacterium]|nr:hypothetical protein [Bacteroidales bacterium]